MAVNLNPPIRHKLEPLLSQPYFRRNAEQIRPQRIKRKIKLGPKHIIISFLLIGGLFFFIQQAYLFLITWDRLDVDRIEIHCTKPGLRNSIQNIFYGKKLGNLLLLDIGRIQEIIKSYTWVKDVHVKKIFPSAVDIEITERVPIAIIKKDRFYLIDRDGILLQAFEQTENSGLPLITDSSGFKKDFEDKFELALSCLESLPPEHKYMIQAIDMSKYRCVSVKLDQNSPWLILGESDFSNKIREYMDKRPYFAKFGELQSINMRFKDRFILTPEKKLSNKQTSLPEKEGS
jgi:cell division septal protein FtsQ